MADTAERGKSAKIATEEGVRRCAPATRARFMRGARGVPGAFDSRRK